MASSGLAILCLNAGSSSLKFAVYLMAGREKLVASGQVERIGDDSTGSFTTQAADRARNVAVGAKDHAAALTWILQQINGAGLGFNAVGHRVVHGGRFTEPQLVSEQVLAELRGIAPFDPDHMPAALMGIEHIAIQRPGLPQVLCFDTTFHRSMPDAACTYPLPARYRGLGLQRYGFHGLSYQYLMEELGRVAPDEARGRVVLAHLGNGASMAAVHRGRCVDTTMGFTPTGGLVMGTRSGDLDPGLLLYLLEHEGLSPEELSRLLNNESGMLAVSGDSSDMRDLLAAGAGDKAAALAVEVFCLSAAKHLAAMSASLGGVDTIVFAGGIGEHASEIRKRIGMRLGHLGVTIVDRRNEQNEGVISAPDCRVRVRVIPTNEELMIVRATARRLSDIN